MKRLFAKISFLFASLIPFLARAEEAAVETVETTEAAAEAVEVVEAAASTVGKINFPAFLDTLTYMGEGLLGIFTVMIAIWMVIWALCKIAKVLAK